MAKNTTRQKRGHNKARGENKRGGENSRTTIGHSRVEKGERTSQESRKHLPRQQHRACHGPGGPTQAAMQSMPWTRTD